MDEHTSRELSQRLYDKGFRAEHEYKWFAGGNESEVNWHNAIILSKQEAYREPGFKKRAIPAYTFPELWGIVPHIIEVNHKMKSLVIQKHISGEMRIGYTAPCKQPSMLMCSHSPAEAIGLLVEWLIDNGHIKVSQVEGEK